MVRRFIRAEVSSDFSQESLVSTVPLRYNTQPTHPHQYTHDSGIAVIPICDIAKNLIAIKKLCLTEVRNPSMQPIMQFIIMNKGGATVLDEAHIYICGNINDNERFNKN